MQIPLSTEYCWSPDTLDLEIECACMGESLILTIRKETHIMQKHRRNRWRKSQWKSHLNLKRTNEGTQTKVIILLLEGQTEECQKNLRLITQFTQSSHKI